MRTPAPSPQGSAAAQSPRLTRAELVRPLRRGLPVFLLGCLVGAAVLFHFVGDAMRAQGGALGAPLDDVFIHFQYARSIAEGHPFAYNAGQPTSSGASSLLWVGLLTPFYALGVRGLHLLWVAWLYAVLASGLIFAAGRGILRELGARQSAIVGPALIFAWGWFDWHAASAMEGVVTTAFDLAVWWSLLRFAAAPGEARRRWAPLVGALAALMPLLRPEASPASLAASGMLLLFASGRARLSALLPLAGVASVPLFWKLVTGTSRAAGAQAKWAFAHPYRSPEFIERWLGLHADQLDHWISGTGSWTAGYFPAHEVPPVLALGALLTLWRASRPRRSRGAGGPRVSPADAGSARAGAGSWWRS